jgi:hypothetical protein
VLSGASLFLFQTINIKRGNRRKTTKNTRNYILVPQGENLPRVLGEGDSFVKYCAQHLLLDVRNYAEKLQKKLLVLHSLSNDLVTCFDNDV